MGAALNQMTHMGEEFVGLMGFTFLFFISQFLLLINNSLLLFLLFKNFSGSYSLLTTRIIKLWPTLYTIFFVISNLSILFSFCILVFIPESLDDSVLWYGLFISYMIIQFVFNILIGNRQKFSLVLNKIIFVTQCLFTLLFTVIGSFAVFHFWRFGKTTNKQQ